MQINDDPYSVLPPFCCSTFSYFCTGPIILCTFNVSFYYAINFKKYCSLKSKVVAMCEKVTNKTKRV